MFVKFIDRGARLFQTDQEGNNSLHWIALLGRLKMLIHLLSIMQWDNLVALAKMQNNYQEIPLHYAVRHYVKSPSKDGLEVVRKLLLFDPSSIIVENKHGATPLFWAKKSDLHTKVPEFNTVFHPQLIKESSKHIVSRDIAKGRERYPVAAITDVFDDPNMMKSLQFRYK